MDIWKYRKYIVNQNDWTYITHKVNPNNWKHIFPTDSINICYNHPFVDKQLGYWNDESTIVVGYCLKTNRKIIHPIWQSTRHKQLARVLRELDCLK